MNEQLKKRFFNTYNFSNHNNKKLILPLNIWMIESSLPEKEDFHSCLNMEGITDSDYTHAKRVCKYF